MSLILIYQLYSDFLELKIKRSFFRIIKKTYDSGV